MSQHISISGATVFWSASSATSLAKLTANLASIGLDRFAPSKPSLQVAMKAALTDLFAAPRVLVRPDRTGFSVVEEVQTPLGLRHSTILTVEAAQHHPGGMLVYPATADERDRVMRAIAAQQELVPTASITNMLTAIVKMLGGIALRQTGGIYWIPQCSVAQWAKVVAAVQGAGPNSLYTVTTVADQEGVRAVCDAIRSEMGTELAQLQEDLSSGLNVKGIKTRAAALTGMVERLRAYEDALGITLDDVRQTMCAADTVLIAASGDTGVGGDALGAFGGMDFD